MKSVSLSLITTILDKFPFEISYKFFSWVLALSSHSLIILSLFYNINSVCSNKSISFPLKKDSICLRIFILFFLICSIILLKTNLASFLSFNEKSLNLSFITFYIFSTLHFWIFSAALLYNFSRLI